MPVRCENSHTVIDDTGVIRRNRKSEHHLIDFGIAIPSHGDNLPRQGIQHRNDLLRRICERQAVTRAVIEQVSQKHDGIRSLGIDGIHQLPTPMSRSVNIGCDDELHDSTFPQPIR